MNPPSGFWRRYAAYSVDAAALVLLASPLLWPRLQRAGTRLLDDLDHLQMRLWELVDASLGVETDPFALAHQWAGDPALHDGIATLARELAGHSLFAAAILFVLGTVWFIASESSSWQATPGKRLAGLRVTTRTGARCGPGRTAARFFAGIASWVLLNLGHAIAAWTPGKRALHDYIAGTRVELAPGASAKMPRWAVSWLLLQAAAFFGLVGFVLLRYLQLAIEVARYGLG